jgi:hypothetical protein
MKFEELSIRSIGNTIQFVGVVYQGEGKTLLCLFPGEELESHTREVLGYEGCDCKTLEMSLLEWQAFIRQTDLMETEVLAKAKNGTLMKVFARKSQRQIDQSVSWKVFKRDGYKCRYCGRDDVPLTVDHLVRWEEGGPSTEENLVAACRKCNRVRGDTDYEAWLKHDYYLRVSMTGLTDDEMARNRLLVGRLREIPRVEHIRSR